MSSPRASSLGARGCNCGPRRSGASGQLFNKELESECISPIQYLENHQFISGLSIASIRPLYYEANRSRKDKIYRRGCKGERADFHEAQALPMNQPAEAPPIGAYPIMVGCLQLSRSTRFCAFISQVPVQSFWFLSHGLSKLWLRRLFSKRPQLPWTASKSIVSKRPQAHRINPSHFQARHQHVLSREEPLWTCGGSRAWLPTVICVYLIRQWKHWLRNARQQQNNKQQPKHYMVKKHSMRLCQEVAAVFNECADPSSKCLSSAVEKFLLCCLSLLVANLDEMHCRYFVDGLHVSPAVTPKLVEALHRAGVLQGGLGARMRFLYPDLNNCQ